MAGYAHHVQFIFLLSQLTPGGLNCLVIDFALKIIKLLLNHNIDTIDRKQVQYKNRLKSIK